MKLLAVAAASALLMLGTAAQAQQKSPLYGELGYSFIKFDDGNGGNSRPGVLRGILGYDFHPMFAVEGLVGFGIQDDDTTNVINGTPVRIDYDVKHIWGVYGKAKYNYQNWEFYGRLGFADTKIDGEAVGIARADDSDTDLSYGVGVNFNFNPKWYGGVDYMVYNTSGDARVRGITLSVGYRF